MPIEALVDGDVEASLAKLLFDIDETGVLLQQQAPAHPGKLSMAHARFGDVDGRAGQVRADNIALRRGRIAIDPHQVLLILNRPHRRADLERLVELGGVRLGQVGEKIGCPGTAITMILGQALVDGQDR